MLKPIYDNVLIERIEEENKTKGGIIIPDTAKEKSYKGKIVAVGPGRLLNNGKVEPMKVKEGDIVLFTKWNCENIKIENKEYVMVRQVDILGVIEDGV